MNPSLSERILNSVHMSKTGLEGQEGVDCKRLGSAQLGRMIDILDTFQRISTGVWESLSRYDLDGAWMLLGGHFFTAYWYLKSTTRSP
jgi:hypothetical protein